MKMFNFDYLTKEDLKEHNLNWPEIPDHSCRILIVRGSGSRIANALLNLKNDEFILIKSFCMLKIHVKKNISR